MSKLNWRLDSIIKSDGSLDKPKIGWLTGPQRNALIEKLHLNWQQAKVQNNILQGKLNAYRVEDHAQADMDLYDMTEKYRALERRFKKLLRNDKIKLIMKVNRINS